MSYLITSIFRILGHLYKEDELRTKSFNKIDKFKETERYIENRIRVTVHDF